eukprot:g4891.t1
MEFLKPKKYDPDAAQRLAEKAAAREAEAREKRAQEKARRRALKEELGLSSSKADSRRSRPAGESSSDPTGSVENAGAASDYSAPSASDTSDSEDGSSYDEDHVGGGDDDDDDDVTALLHRMQLKGESMCPMRQYELLQRRYLRSVQEVKNYAERERESEQVLSELKIMGKRQRAMIMRTAEQNMEAKDNFISGILEKLKALSASDTQGVDSDRSALADLPTLVDSLESEFQELSASLTRFLPQGHNKSASPTPLDNHDIDTIQIELSKVKACNISLEAENNELRQALTDLGNKDPEKLVLVRQQLEDAESKLKEVELHLEEAILEKEAAEEDAGIARGLERAAKSRAEALSGVKSKDVQVTGETNAAALIESKRRNVNERKLLKEIKHLKSKVKKLGASKLALMSILKDAQAELAKRPVADSKKVDDRGLSEHTVEPGISASQSSNELKKKDKKIHKLKAQVKELTSILRELEEAKKADRSLVSEKGQHDECSKTEDAERENIKIQALEKKIQVLLAERATLDSKLADMKDAAEAERNNVSDSHEKVIQGMEGAVKAAEERANRHKSICDDLRRQLSDVKRNAATEKQQLILSVRSLEKKTSSLRERVVSFGKRFRDAKTGMRADLLSMQKAIKSELDNIPDAVAQAQLKITEKLDKQLSAFKGLADKYKREYRERKRLFNLVQELRGNIRVFCRVRPINASEVFDGRECVITFPENESDELMVDMGRGRKKRFEFDKVFKPGCTNADVFSDLADLCMSVLDGYNVCIFA